jgi:hypothetical protein
MALVTFGGVHPAALGESADRSPRDFAYGQLG